MRGRNQAKFPNAAFDQRRQRVINHRLVVNGLELFARDECQRKQTRTGAAGENDAFHPRENRRCRPKWKGELPWAPGGSGEAAVRTCSWQKWRRTNGGDNRAANDGLVGQW